MPLGEGGSSTGVDYGRSRHAAKGRNGSSSESPIAGTDYQGGNVETRMMKSEPSIQISVEHWNEIVNSVHYCEYSCMISRTKSN